MPPRVGYREVLQRASDHLVSLSGHVFDVLTVKKPDDMEGALNLVKVVSKLSPLIGNMIEFETVKQLNMIDWGGDGRWRRQDPGFPDAIYDGLGTPAPGIEIKAWYPLATEITARFKDSQTHFDQDQTNVAMLAWLPEGIISGRPKLMDVWIAPGKSVALARDRHYHDPPDYIVIEPGDTSARTSNLQQTNTSGHKFQGDATDLANAHAAVQSLGLSSTYSPDPAYQQKLRQLMGQFHYRVDTNYAKMDRIEHESLEQFKTRVLGLHIHGLTVERWSRVIAEADERELRRLL